MASFYILAKIKCHFRNTYIYTHFWYLKLKIISTMPRKSLGTLENILVYATHNIVGLQLIKLKINSQIFIISLFHPQIRNGIFIKTLSTHLRQQPHWYVTSFQYNINFYYIYFSYILPVYQNQVCGSIQGYYRRGLNAKEAAWANKKYRGYRLLPDSIIEII